ncbi:hypothetical protein BO71DRAFT_424807 [Aspergillus ellipticus CBS 707.79]|uniref:Sacsin/Nov domain-containing protein n=1 Tax=Aspergillus ellipticus CBS 707.79 TaxID=1448320 RepID=A0A319DQK6_9EURO|nr:hypothetical protein BO71DRAFT_424807 [Aspergillus ellipticus CBS 707.79]
MEDTTLETRTIAKEHIDGIGAQYASILNNEKAHTIIDRALQLYLLNLDTLSPRVDELIQNVDDNKYADDVTPALSLLYRDRLLRTDCNEAGFTPKQVDAISNLGFSTKKNQAESTGEKGVGFKSVFGVADCVWVASGAYAFKFDSSSPMGMLTPMWEGPPGGAQPANTSMYLRFLPQVDEKHVFHDLDLVGGKVLTFLRKRRELRLHIELQSGGRVFYDVKRQDLISNDGLPMTQLTFTGAKFPTPKRKAYVVCRYPINSMPEEKKYQY